MKIDNSRILLTGAGSGIGRATALALAARGARLALVGRNRERLEAVRDEIAAAGRAACVFDFDLARVAGHEALAQRAILALGGLDVLVNNAGVSSFRAFAEEDPQALARLVQTNLTGTLLLTRAVLPHLLKQNRGRIVNLGSIFGSIGFAHFAAYSATKFALRGFSEALRRELADTGVGVSYVAPRSTRTGLNSEAVTRMAQASGMKMDEPEAVARQIVRALEQDRKEVYIGGPEGFFVRLNSLLPRLVDFALRKQDRIARRHATAQG